MDTWKKLLFGLSALFLIEIWVWVIIYLAYSEELSFAIGNGMFGSSTIIAFGAFLWWVGEESPGMSSSYMDHSSMYVGIAGAAGGIVLGVMIMFLLGRRKRTL